MLGLGALAIPAMLTMETSYAARAPRQESGQLNEPCHCGQTPRHPENKQRRGLEELRRQVGMTFPPKPAPDWPTNRSSSPSRQPQQPSGSKNWSPALPAWTSGTGVPQRVLGTSSDGAGQTGDGVNRIQGLLREGWLGQRASALQTARGRWKRYLLPFRGRSWSHSLGRCSWWPPIRGFAHLLCGNGLSPLGTWPASSMEAKFRISLHAARCFIGSLANAPGT